VNLINASLQSIRDCDFSFNNFTSNENGEKGRSLKEKEQHFIKSRNTNVYNDLQHYTYQNEY